MKTITPFKTFKNLFKVAAVLLVVAAFTSCKKDKEPVGTAYIQVINNDEQSTAIDFYMNGAKKNATGISYNQSSGYFSVSAEQQQGQFKTTGGLALFRLFDIEPSNGGYYSIVYMNDKVLAYSDNPSATPPGKARVRFINLSTAITGDVDFGIDGGDRLSNSLIQYLATDYYTVDPASKFKVYAAGTANVLLDIPITLQAGKIYTIYATGGTSSLFYNAVISNP